MFDVTPDDIAQLNDRDLRELVGRLCEAELATRGLSPAAVTWGGNQTAADGGLDVRVALPPSAAIDNFIPRPATGFQVKTPDMPRAAIIAEMRPAGILRPVIRELADEAGAYVIVSSNSSTSDSALRNRRKALREGLDGIANADQLDTDFYDRTRLATWVRRHSGLTIWVREKVGRTLVGWRPYGAWSSVAEGVEAEYLLDDKLRLHFGKRRDAPAQPLPGALDELRDEIAQLGRSVRLVGLSGVGKTRLVQALFDARIGARPLPPSLAVYTNLSDNPVPQPPGVALDLIANRTRAILIVDNCTSDLHRRLSALCAVPESTISLLTVEYDIRDDQPEGTQVVTLDTSSPELIEKLVRRRYSHLSQVDASTVADFSGGNARIAIALAETVGQEETIGGLSDDDLFQRLFRQHHDADEGLLRAAEACSLVYSFEGEALTGAGAELPKLAMLADQSPRELYRHLGELQRRDLVQKRNVWRAVLPHAIANRLAAKALDDTPADLIERQLVEEGTERLARSFSRRLSFLHDHLRAVGIVARWLVPGGLLGDVAALDDLGRAMFENVAPVLPAAALDALERVGDVDPEVSALVWNRHRTLLRSLAYDPSLFERSVSLLVRATQGADDRSAKEMADTIVSLFTIYLSGTHASIEQRLGVIGHLLHSSDQRQRSLGLSALDAALKSNHFSAIYPFEFGARSRDYGHYPRSSGDVANWFGAALALIDRLAFGEGILKSELRHLVAGNLSGLWTFARLYDNVERLFCRFTAEGFWREGWLACRRTFRFDKDRLTSEGSSRLTALEAALAPSNLAQRVRAVVLGENATGLDLELCDHASDYGGQFERLTANSRELGTAVAGDEAVFEELLPDLVRSGNRLWAFGQGFAATCGDLRGAWARLVEALRPLPPEQGNVQMLCGFLAELWQRDKDLTQDLLDSALAPPLVPFLPVLHSAVELDTRGIDRLMQALNSGQAPVSVFRHLSLGRAADGLGGDLNALLSLIADQPGGFDVALELLFFRLYANGSAKRAHEPELLDAGRQLLQSIRFGKNNQRNDHYLAAIVRSCLKEPHAAPIAGEVAMHLKLAVSAYETYAFDNDDLLKALLSVQPLAVLEEFFRGTKKEQRIGFQVFDHFDGSHRANPADAISPESLITWCEGDPQRRYALAASFVTFAHRSDEIGPEHWSEQAKVLLSNAPEPNDVLAMFVQRFKPHAWSGSRAALIEAHASLLDSLGTDVSVELVPLIAEAKAQLAREIAAERRWETEHDRNRDERFE